MLNIPRNIIKPLLFLFSLVIAAVVSISVDAHDPKKKYKKHRMNYKSFSPDPRDMLKGKPSFMIMQGQDMGEDEGTLVYDSEGNQILPCGEGGNCHPNYVLAEYEEPIYEYTVKVIEIGEDYSKNSVPKLFNSAHANHHICVVIIGNKLYEFPTPCPSF